MRRVTRSKIAVTIAFKNRELIRSLVASIRSFLKQTLPPDELIVVGTKDDLSGLNKYFSKDEFKTIRVIFSTADKNEARNIGIDAALSEYVMFADHDMRADKNLLFECAKFSKECDALFVPEKGSGGGFWEECHKLQKEFVQYDLDTITPRFFRKSIFKKGEKPFKSDFGDLDEWGFNLSLQKKRIRKGIVNSHVVIKEKVPNLYKEIKNKFTRGLYLFNFYKVDSREAWRRVDPIKRGIIFYSTRLKYFFQKPAVFTGLLFLKTVSLVSFFLGAIVGFFLQPCRKILKKDIRNFYNSIANSYLDKMYKETEWSKHIDYKEKESVIKIWRLYGNDRIKKEKILDLGMGPGRWSKFFLDAGFSKVVGLDISDKMVNKAKREIKDVRFRSVVADIEKIPFRDYYFNKVFCFRTFKYLPSPKNAMNEITRVTKNRGEILLEISNNNLQNRFLKLLSHLVVLIKPNISPSSRWWYFNRAKLYSFNDAENLLAQFSNIKVVKIEPLFMLPSVRFPKIFDKHLFKTLIFLDNFFMIILPKRLFARSWLILLSKL